MAELSEQGWYILKTIELPRGWYWLPEDFETAQVYYDYWAATDTHQIQLSWDINSQHSIRIHKFQELSEDNEIMFDLDGKVFHSKHPTKKEAINEAIRVMEEIKNTSESVTEKFK